MTDARTERVSPRKLAAAGRKPMSRALFGAAALIALGLALDVRAIGEGLEPSLRAAFAVASDPNPKLAALPVAWADGARGLALILGPLLGAVIAGVVFVGVLQLAPLGSSGAGSVERKAPFDVAARFQQLFAAERITDALVSTAMFIVLAAVAWLTLAPNVRGVLALSGAEPHVAAPALIELFTTLARRLVLTGFALGALDYAQRRVRHMLSLRMTRRELLDEQREQYGDPAIRAERARRLRAAAQGKARP